MKNLFIICACALTIWSCKENEPDGGQKSGAISVDTETVSFLNNGTPSEAGADQVTVTASGEWRLSGPQDWCTPSAVSGKDGAKVTFTAKANPSGEPRVATFAFINGGNAVKVLVQQNEGNVFAISQTTFNVMQPGEKIKLSVFKNTNLTYAIASTDTWITDVSTPAPSSSGTKDPLYLSFQVAANTTGAHRTGKIVFTDHTTSITQEVTIYQLSEDVIVPPVNTDVFVPVEGDVLEFDYTSNVPLIVLIQPVDMTWISDVSTEPGKFKFKISKSVNGRVGHIKMKTPKGSVGFALKITQLGAEPQFVDVPEGDFKELLIKDELLLANGSKFEITTKGLTLTDMTYSSKALTSVKGIEYFTALTKVTLSTNSLTELDLSKNLALTYVRCDKNQLTKLDVSALTEIDYLNFATNSLTAIDVSKNLKLITLNCSINKIVDLDISANTLLKTLTLGGNPLEKIALGTSAVTSLSFTSKTLPMQGVNPVISGEKLKTISIATSPNMITVDVVLCPSLETLTVGTGNTGLTTIYKKADQVMTITKPTAATIVEK